MAGGKHGLELVFDPALDGGGWPGPLGDRAGCLGEAWVGPQGLLDRLETELGLGRLVPHAAERAAQLADDLRDGDGYWRASYDVDPLGTARRLLVDRDALWLWGWRGQPVSDRLSALAKATRSASPGLPDRLERIGTALDARRPDIDRLILCSPPHLLPTRWRVVFDKLRALGTAVAERPVAPARASGDLAAARSPAFSPASDGTLTMLRAHGPMATAHEVAGCLAALDSLDGVVVVGADEVLASALEHKGLPRVPGAATRTGSIAAVRLVVDAMFFPTDPRHIYALLSLNPGPIPASIARRLIAALSRLPGRGSPDWTRALDEGLLRIDAERRDRVRARVLGLLHPCAAGGEPAAIDQVLDRLRLLSTWARGVANTTPQVIAVAVAAEVFGALLSRLPSQDFTRIQLQRLLDELDDVGVDAGDVQAGLGGVREPGAVLGPARIIVWWGFSRDRARRPARLRLSQNERAALGALGVTPPDAGTMARADALRWRRPLEQATDSLVLCCPRNTENCDAAFPHPLWDELTAAMGGGRAAAKLTAPRLRLPAEPRRRTVTLRPLPVAKIDWSVGHAIELRDAGESPSSLEKLLGCSFAWALHYHARIGRRIGPPATPGPLLFGQVAHHVLAAVFEGGAMDEEAARAGAERAFVDRLGDLCETLLLPRFQVERAELKRAIVSSAGALAGLLETTGAQVRGVEVALEREMAELRLFGAADLVLADPDVVIDLKWGRTTNRRKMERGAALQLAAYAELARTGPNRPEVAYFILRTQELFGEPRTSLPGADSPGEHLAIDTWRGAMSSLALTNDELAAGVIRAPGAVGEDAESQLNDDGVLHMAPPCYFCGYGALCGRGRAT